MELDTPSTLRARQLRDVYNSISMKHATQDERLDALLTLKQTVKVNIFTRVPLLVHLNWLLRVLRHGNLASSQDPITTSTFFAYLPFFRICPNRPDPLGFKEWVFGIVGKKTFYIPVVIPVTKSTAVNTTEVITGSFVIKSIFVTVVHAAYILPAVLVNDECEIICRN